MNNNDFNSIDRLMEIGMSMAVANQMISTMNNAVNAMHIPGQPYINPSSEAAVADDGSQPSPQPEAPQPEYYVIIDEKVSGPYEYDELSLLVTKEKLRTSTLIWRTGLSGWKYAMDLPEINKLIVLYS